jgi:enoyl-CoA hydratase/carnithine racemase
MSESNAPVAVNLDSGVATIRLQGRRLNAFDTDMRKALGDVLDALELDKAVRAVVFWGGEKYFAAGADIGQLAAMGYEEIVGWNRAVQSTFTRVAELPFPVVAAINGPALGGGLELALAADFRIVGEGSRLGLPEVQLGIMPGAGGTQRLTRLVGPTRAKSWMMTGRRLSGTEALDLGLAEEVVADDQVYDRAHSFARELARGPRFALSAIKQAVDQGGGASGLALERALIAGLFATEDKREGLRSFLADGPGKARFA